jgi:hypothetical protein
MAPRSATSSTASSRAAPADVPPVADLVTLLDVAPTFVRLAAATPPAGLPGSDLLAAARDPARVAYAEFGDMFAVRSRTHLLLVRLFQHGGTTLDPDFTRRVQEAQPGRTSFGLHAVDTDPLQEHDVLTVEGRVGLELHHQLLAIRQGPGAPPREAMSPERIRALRESGAFTYF